MRKQVFMSSVYKNILTVKYAAIDYKRLEIFINKKMVVLYLLLTVIKHLIQCYD